MKKLLVLSLAVILVFGGCGKKAENTVPETPEANQEIALKDKVNETAYAGRVTEITDKEITIIMDEVVSETFKLNDKAKNDIKALDIKVDSRILINFDTVENREITSVEVELTK